MINAKDYVSGEERKVCFWGGSCEFSKALALDILGSVSGTCVIGHYSSNRA